MTKLPWREEFRAGPGDAIVLYRTAFQGLGAGLPSGDEGGKLRLENGWIVLEGIHREFPRIALSPSDFTEHRLEVGGRGYDLWALAAGREPLTLEIERWPLVAVAGWRAFQWAKEIARSPRCRKGLL